MFWDPKWVVATGLTQFWQGWIMEEYRVYFLDPDGHVSRRVDFVCEDEEAARQHARQLVDGRAVELWTGTRLVEHVPAKH